MKKENLDLKLKISDKNSEFVKKMNKLIFENLKKTSKNCPF